jgi:hypothetical protein
MLTSFETPNSVARDLWTTATGAQVVICDLQEQSSDNAFLTLDEPESETVALFDAPIKTAFITDLEDGYALIRPIPVQIMREGDGHARASFEEANIAIGGTSDQDAFQSLFAEILDTFDDLCESEQHLGPDAQRQLQLLRTYIVKT